MTAAARGLSAGDKAPDFKLATGDGAAISRTSLKGQPFVIYFYPKDDTSGCTKEAIDFNALKCEFEKAGVAVVGVSPDSCASHVAFKSKHKLDLDLVSDETKSTLQAYGVWTEKSMYGRTYMGVERTTFLIGRDGRIAAVWNKVKVPDHAAAVLAAARDIK